MVDTKEGYVLTPREERRDRLERGEVTAVNPDKAPRLTEQLCSLFTRGNLDTVSSTSDDKETVRLGSKDGMFVDVAEMKAKVRQALLKPEPYDVKSKYKTTGFWQKLARHSLFENVTLAVIGVNAIWIAVDTDYNDQETLADAKWYFQMMEHSFCVFFSFEWFVRFQAFRNKCDGFTDGWFVFDSCLVFSMVMETWVLTLLFLVIGGGGGSPLGGASILRLFRLLRLTRMARMLKSMPELLILIKGMISAMRSVFFTLCLLIIILYVFAIAFTQLSKDFVFHDLFFSSVSLSMYTLLVAGTFLDNLTSVTTSIGNESGVCVALFFVFVLLAALTVMNMLIGVLCEVVSAVAATEKEGLLVSFVSSNLQAVLQRIDTDGNCSISRKEFHLLIEDKIACEALMEVDVDPLCVIDYLDYIFDSGDDGDGEDDGGGELSFAKFMEVVLQLRGTNTATVKDILDLRQFVQTSIDTLSDRIGAVIGRLPPRGKSLLNRESSKRVQAPQVEVPTLPHMVQDPNGNPQQDQGNPISWTTSQLTTLQYDGDVSPARHDRGTQQKSKCSCACAENFDALQRRVDRVEEKVDNVLSEMQTISKRLEHLVEPTRANSDSTTTSASISISRCPSNAFAGVSEPIGRPGRVSFSD
eukprot:TRINITY_DN2274_c0_g1_i4.p1 TRINITY_DN2274_c0_g1~~TRINITY_DN2274_c0_g1_i4.p1  ORF type:complete len:641 (+),score=113.38 TRINITY_DN2274_c0_g1_i4:202-2124(+)